MHEVSRVGSTRSGGSASCNKVILVQEGGGGLPLRLPFNRHMAITQLHIMVQTVQNGTAKHKSHGVLRKVD